ncbi:hypothetical protein SKAU_G00248350 [Synaphobranchus kaupii]|uniref:Uncharacterized protein n=1 Tax=Synaphobranchus kaupii TaxID=118154 RepID=A0A9Q1F2K5_SYNKA|nr:hypothetical protein SKAU_G00248350 [Synaphobranchus kaupii]
MKYKLGNYRSKLRQAGCIEVSINRKRRNDGDDGASPSLKRANRGEINHVPDHPDNHTDDSLEEERLALVEEFKKRNKNVALIKQQMELTFSLRRKEIVDLEPMVSEVRERWPALFCEAEIREEFHRITNKNLIDDFRAAINQHTPGLHRLYRARRTAFLPAMDQLLNRLDEETSDITAHRQTAALKGLPLYLRDSHEKLFRNCLDTDPEEEQTKGLIVGILTVLEDDDSSAPARIMNIAVILEEDIVLQDLPDLPTAFAFLFGLIYALNLQYPKELRYTFETIQKVFMELGTDLSARTDVTEFEMWLQDYLNIKPRQNLVTHLAAIGGSDPKRVTWNILAHLFADNVAKMINWKGANGKLSFAAMAAKVIVIWAVRKNQLTQNATNNDIGKNVHSMIWLSIRPGWRTQVSRYCCQSSSVKRRITSPTHSRYCSLDSC